MSTYNTPELLAAASQNTYVNNVEYQILVDAGFEQVNPNSYSDSSTGFEADLWFNAEENEYIVAYRGTDQSLQDAYTDLQYGRPQFDSDSSIALLDFLSAIVSPDAKVHFTGHSLGGALAQYGAYEFLEDHGEVEVTITTFNALGSVAGQTQYGGGYDSNRLIGVQATHYRIKGDGVSLLGGRPYRRRGFVAG